MKYVKSQRNILKMCVLQIGIYLYPPLCIACGPRLCRSVKYSTDNINMKLQTSLVFET
jgi:hypothetical protein